MNERTIYQISLSRLWRNDSVISVCLCTFCYEVLVMIPIGFWVFMCVVAVCVAAVIILGR